MKIKVCGSCGKRVDVETEEFEFGVQMAISKSKLDLCGECADLNELYWEVREQEENKEEMMMFEPWIGI